MSNWICITDQTPPEGELIFLFAPFSKSKIFTGYYSKYRGQNSQYRGKYMFSDAYYSTRSDGVTHWKYLNESEYPKCDSFQAIIEEFSVKFPG